jgi:hypothetical protein
MKQFTENRPTETGSEWNTLEPETLPRPTYWPAVMALGITFLALGIATTLLISGVGLILFILALARWIGELRHE